ncbi:hypothetical protein B0H11DRAFT_1929029 [Mycena galericulata]|nr:hypothetical protein B0H11DRAFT_1932586 [Mycena galericulata]KAJ7448699.1 hypothetical protein B0H11DRAFT_1929029 [Mycena galericulata]
MRIDRIRRLPGYSQPSYKHHRFYLLFLGALTWISGVVAHEPTPPRTPEYVPIVIVRVEHHDVCNDSSNYFDYGRSSNALESPQSKNNCTSVSHGPAFRFRGGANSDDDCTITGKKLELPDIFSEVEAPQFIGDSEGAQAQGLGDVIILRRMNLLTVNGHATIDVDSILLVIWKTCIVHFHRGVFALKAYISENDLQYLLGFPYLCSETELQEYYTFCAESSVTKVQSWWAHKLSYPWLLPSLNREISRMDKRHWDLTPRDTNPIEGSHAQDNQVNRTKQSLLDAILLTKKLDSETARIIGATMTSGVMENPNNSLETRYKNQAQRQARAPTPDYIDVDDFHPESPQPRRMQALNLFSGLAPPSPVAEPRSEFDYQAAMKSDVIDTTLAAIVADHPMYPVNNNNNEVLASDPYVVG